MNRILLVEDDALFRNLFVSIGQQAGLVIESVPSGVSVPSLLEEQSYGVVVISDAALGVFDGLSLLLKAVQPGCDLIMLLETADDEAVSTALHQGVSHCLPKPVHPGILLHTVQQCIVRRRLLDENSDLRAMVGLLQTGQALSTCLDPGEACRLIMHALAHEVDVARAIGFVKDEERLIALAHQGGDVCFPPLFLEQIGLLALQQASHSARPVRLLLSRENQGAEISGLREALIVPLVSHNAVFGCVVLFNDAGELLPQTLNSRSIAFLQEHGARALGNALKFEAARDMLFVDELTGLYNYRYLKTALEREIKRADRYVTQLTVMFLDLDNFKGVNDTYGHMIGSGVLRELGALLKKSVREVDVLIRYGGDEYTILLVETGPELGQRIGERIRRQIEDNVFQASEGYSIRLTASIGFACYPDDTTGMQELLNMADQAMYVGKASGKNCVFRVASPLAGAGRAN